MSKLFSTDLFLHLKLEFCAQVWWISGWVREKDDSFFWYFDLAGLKKGSPPLVAMLRHLQPGEWGIRLSVCWESFFDGDEWGEGENGGERSIEDVLRLKGEVKVILSLYLNLNVIYISILILSPAVKWANRSLLKWPSSIRSGWSCVSVKGLGIWSLGTLMQ